MPLSSYNDYQTTSNNNNSDNDDDKNTVYITVIGDPHVGKTSLITSASTETFPEHPPPVLPPSRLPADTTPEGVPVVITDTSSRPEDKQALEAACREASVIVLCFSMDKPQTLRRVSSHWLPEFRRLNVTVPVVLVGCKSDIRPADQSLHQSVMRIVKTYPQIETCMECSAKKLQFVGEVFYYAMKAVIHPMAPLYEPEAQKLRPLCARALKRIFMLCDTDGDGILNDAELNAFQVECFNAPLQPEELIGVKQVVSEKCPEGISNDGLTLKGFLFLHALFIERGRLETTWSVLRQFGYDNTLHLREDLLARAGQLAASAAAAPGQCVVLSPAGRAFFQSTFEKFDVDKDNALSTKEREELFSTAPEDPWKGGPYQGVITESSRRNGFLTGAGFLAMWTYTAATDPRAALAGAIYLGFPANAPLDELLSVSKRQHLAHPSESFPGRTVLQCLAFAAGGEVDLRPVLEGLITQARPAHYSSQTVVTAAVAAVPIGSGVGSGGVSGNGKNEEEPPQLPTSPSPSTSAPEEQQQQQEPQPVTMILRGVDAKQTKMLVLRSSNSNSSSSSNDPTDPTSSSTTTSSTSSSALSSTTTTTPGALPLVQLQKEDLLRCDVAVFVFDGSHPESFRAAISTVVSIASAADDALPCVLLCLNQESISDTMLAEVGSACSALGISPPLFFPQGAATPGSPAAKNAATALRKVFQSIAQAATKPEGHIPETPTLKAAQMYRKMMTKVSLIAAGVTATGLIGYFAYRYASSGSSGSGSGGEGGSKGSGSRT